MAQRSTALARRTGTAVRHRRKVRCAALGVLLVAGCSGPSGSRPNPSPSTSSVAPSSSIGLSPSTTPPTATQPPAPAPDRLVLPATNGAIDTPFDLSAEGTSSTGDIRMSIAHNVGKITYQGRELPAVSYLEQPWPGFDLVLYQTLAVDARGIHIFWIYCSKNTINHVYYETTYGQRMQDQGATGTCTSHAAQIRPAVAFPALNVPLPTPQGAYHISGPEVQLNGAQPGRIRLGGAFARLIVFSLVDCSRICGAQGWYELHSLVIADDGRVTVGILYLQLADPSHVRLLYGISLPDLAWAPSVSYDATWSA